MHNTVGTVDSFDSLERFGQRFCFVSPVVAARYEDFNIEYYQNYEQSPTKWAKALHAMNNTERFEGHSDFLVARNQVAKLDVRKLESEMLIRK